MKSIGIILINYNGEKETVACVESLIKSDTKDLEITIFIIDNHSKEESVAYLKKNLPNTPTPFSLELIENPTNDGFSGGNNIGIKKALENGVDAFVILNNDTIVDPHMIERLVISAEHHPKAGIIVPKIYFAKGYEYHNDRYNENEKGHVIWYAGGSINWNDVIGKHRGVDEVDNGQYDKEENTYFATGCCMLIKREVAEKVGFFDEKYFLYFEDADLSIRVHRGGYTIVYNPQAILWHKNAGSTGGSGSGLQDYFMTRNRLLFGNTYAPARSRMALFRLSIRLLHSGREWEKKGVKDYYAKRFGKGSYTV